MAKKKKNNSRRNDVPKKRDIPQKKSKPEKDGDVPMLNVPENAPLEEIYAEIRRQFTAADLQEYTEPLVGVPMGPVIEKMGEIHREELRKRRKK